ncbi:NADP-dependent oxidoreductase [Mesorhizobium sp. B2-5-4]|uniref:NADP-dependent oxidoreductase n=1 Tax=Mesorhizobium sp. B2-5-4 TaxID=2589926 RepID=UPI001FED97D5|nr:NADP-dependent oxidoreductase [Mesorhizobium sp. B2-5-4]
MATMKAVRIHEFGGPDVLSLEDAPFPQPHDDEVLLKVHASSVNPVDYKIRSGGGKKDQLPMTLGRDVSGTVELCGTRAHTLKKGDPFYAMLGPDRGGQAEYVVVKAIEMAAKPQSVDHLHAAAVPLAALTAWQGLFDHGALTAGQRVLIHGGAGGVGHFAVQLAKAKGAFVATTVSGKDIEFARSLGADQAIDYKNERFEDIVGKVDLVFDLVAGETQDRSWAVVKPGGIIVSTLAEPSIESARKAGASGIHYMAKPNAAQLGEIGRLIDEGKVRPHVDATFPLQEAAAAEAWLENKHVRGKIVLEVAS